MFGDVVQNGNISNTVIDPNGGFVENFLARQYNHFN
jgi:hypothetical protein